MAEAHQITTGAGIVVGLIDTGVDATHQDLTGTVLSGSDFIGNTDGRIDTSGHGTRMAGLIAAHGSGANSIVGVAPDAKILPVRATPDPAKDYGATIRNGDFTWAAHHGAGVICASFGTADILPFREDVAAAVKADVVVVAAAGNAPTDNRVAFPAAYTGVLAVGGVTQSGNHDPHAVTGPEVAISAPSVDIASTTPNNSYSVASGTSEATAIVAGVAALIRAKYPNLSAAEVIHRITATATDKGPPGRDPEYGYGIVNPVAALTADVPPLSAAPSRAPTTAASPTMEATPSTGVNPATVALVGVALLVVAAAGLSIAVVRRRRSQR